ncbi:MAG: hypothetical protein ACRDQU_10785 [Pseudonocardiaceae bacterium]
MTEREDTTMTAIAEPLTTDRTDRRRMPRRRQGYTASVSISGADFYLIYSLDDESRQLTETSSLRS